MAEPPASRSLLASRHLDPRVDRAVAWLLPTIATLAFAIGGWQFRELGAKVDALRVEVVAATVKLAVLEERGTAAALMVERVRVLEERVTRLEGRTPR